MKKPETRKARAARLAKRNARQQAYRARPGRAEAEALASRRSYWRRVHDWRDTCVCSWCTRVAAQGFRKESA